MRDYFRAMRGMVFWYDIEPETDKMNIPRKTTYSGVKYASKLEYGRRPWLVVSCDEFNINSSMVTVVPMTSSENVDDCRASCVTHVHYTYKGKCSTILCEQVRTIDSAELGGYLYCVSSDILDKVDDALSYHLGIKPKFKYTDVGLDSSLKAVEGIIENIIREKYDEISRKSVNTTDLEDATLRLGGMINNLFNSSSCNVLVQQGGSLSKKKESAVDKFNRRLKYAEDYKKSCSNKNGVVEVKKEQPSNSGYRNRWTIARVKEFMEDFDNLSESDLLSKYGLKNKKSACQTRLSLRKKFNLDC